MMIRYLQWAGVALLMMAALFGSGYMLISRKIDQRIGKVYAFRDESLTIPSDSASLTRGKHLVAIKGCQDCHGSDLAGRVMIDDPAIGLIAAVNLTSGEGGLPPDYQTRNWVSALRHGINSDGKPLLLMPSHETTLLSADDLAAIIAYCSGARPVNRVTPETRVGPMAKILTYFDKMPLLSVEKIDHERPILAHADTTEGVEMGKYLAVSCSGCHQTDFKGGEPVIPGSPPVPDLTSTGNLGKWSLEDFTRTLRTGKTPAGHQLKNEDMPWKMTAQYAAKEIASLYRYFRTIK